VNKVKQDTFTRSDIETSLKKEFPNLNKSDINNAINVILKSITEAVALDEKVEIRGFGTFSKKFIRPRKFTNPNTKKISYLGETATMHFKPSKALIDK
jgi:nucleoid DNA-binding protein